MRKVNCPPRLPCRRSPADRTCTYRTQRSARSPPTAPFPSPSTLPVPACALSRQDLLHCRFGALIKDLGRTEIQFRQSAAPPFPAGQRLARLVLRIHASVRHRHGNAADGVRQDGAERGLGAYGSLGRRLFFPNPVPGSRFETFAAEIGLRKPRPTPFASTKAYRSLFRRFERTPKPTEAIVHDSSVARRLTEAIVPFSSQN